MDSGGVLPGGKDYGRSKHKASNRGGRGQHHARAAAAAAGGAHRTPAIEEASREHT